MTITDEEIREMANELKKRQKRYSFEDTNNYYSKGINDMVIALENADKDRVFQRLLEYAT